ncbi:cytochrome P450 [Streptoalloteichus hindustanus]|uniref:Cytochrome P450 n=1 Tax=Streptoalloteichus hindustanus TaxID=2017 RepID=A0A1M5CZ21_STRHI|nr:cytochrome P450 [Streptoalloteichus hindustanus]SHF59884.1 Cytochrome P450 [Streptoalloteichus hindustanus]
MPFESAPAPFPFRSSPTPLDLPPDYARLRRRAPASRVRLPTGDTAWLVTSHAGVRGVLTDPLLSRAAAVRPRGPRCNAVVHEPTTLGAMDPPEHTRLRRLVAPAFTARRIERLRPGVERLVRRRVDAIVHSGPPADLVAELAQPLPITVICELLGVPEGDRAAFHAWAEVFLSAGGHPPHEVHAARARFQRYFAELIAARRARDGDDLLRALAAAHSDEDRLSQAELVNLCVSLLVNGFATTTTQIVNSLVALFRHPDELARLRADPGLVPLAVEELLRFVPHRSDGGAVRVATGTVELCGVEIPAGDGVIPAVSAANHDPDVFPAPDRLDVGRARNPHLTFGHGIHHCLGVHLARLELTTVLDALVRRLPRLRLAVAEHELRWHTDTLLPSPVHLPVTW